jgi:hypothetical protein
MNRTILVLCVLGTASCILSSCAESKWTDKIGEHRLEIVETHVFGGGEARSSSQSMSDGTRVYVCESDKTKIRLEGEVLTVNGKRYVIPHKDDSIRIKDGRVEINGQPAKPEDNKVHE